MTLFIIFLSLSVSGFSHTKYFHCVKLTPDDFKIRLLGGIYCLEDMTSSPLNNNAASQFSAWEKTPPYAPTPGDFGRERTPSEYCLSLNHTYGGGSTPLGHPESCRLGFLDEPEYHDGTYNEGSPSSIIYLIEWKVTLNNRILAKNTEQDLVLKPSSYWQQIKEKADHVVRRKIIRKQRVRADDTTVVVSVNDRQHRDLTKHFEDTDVNWTAIEKQLLMWENLFLEGKKLRLSISINYIEDSSTPGGTDKRGKSSRTKRMLHERDARVDAEQFSSGQPSVWREVYRTMRFPGQPCHHDGQFCWLDPVDKKHYRLNTIHLTRLVNYVERGGVLDIHDDVPHDIREQIYNEEQERGKKKQKPAQNDSIDIPGLLDVAVEECTNWHLSRVSAEIFKENIRKARDVTLENFLDLKQIYDHIDPDFFVKEGVKIGVARRFVSDITLWIIHCDEIKAREDGT